MKTTTFPDWITCSQFCIFYSFNSLLYGLLIVPANFPLPNYLSVNILLVASDGKLAWNGLKTGQIFSHNRHSRERRFGVWISFSKINFSFFLRCLNIHSESKPCSLKLHYQNGIKGKVTFSLVASFLLGRKAFQRSHPGHFFWNFSGDYWVICTTPQWRGKTGR